MAAALLVFALTYLAIGGSRLPFVVLDRPAASFVGAVAMVVAGALVGLGVLWVERALGL